MKSVNKLLIVETGSQGDVEKLQGHKKLEEFKISVELPRKRNPLVIFYDVLTALADMEFREETSNSSSVLDQGGGQPHTMCARSLQNYERFQ